MRFVVFILGLLACTLTALFGGACLLWDMFLGFAIENLPANTIDPSATTTMMGVSIVNAGLVLVVAALYGFLGAIFALGRCGKQASLLMIVPVLGGALLNPWSLIFTSGQFFAVLLSLFVGPLPLNPSEDDEVKPRAKAKKSVDDDDEDEVKPKAKAKKPVVDDDESSFADEEDLPKPKGKPKPKVDKEDEEEGE